MSDLEKAREAQRLINAYKETFGSDSGKLVLEDLKKRFGFSQPAFIPTPSGSFDPLWAAVRDGQRQVLLHIEHQLGLPYKGDGNVEKPQTTIIK